MRECYYLHISVLYGSIPNLRDGKNSGKVMPDTSFCPRKWNTESKGMSLTGAGATSYPG